MFKDSFSQTQLANLNSFAGLLAIILPKLGILASFEEILFWCGAIYSIGWTAYGYYDRWTKKDINLAGFRYKQY